MTMVIHEVGHISTQPGEDHLCGSVMNTEYRGAQQ